MATKIPSNPEKKAIVASTGGAGQAASQAAQEQFPTFVQFPRLPFDGTILLHVKASFLRALSPREKSNPMTDRDCYFPLKPMKSRKAREL